MAKVGQTATAGVQPAVEIPSSPITDPNDPDPPLDWISRAHVYADEEGKPLLRISLEFSHESFPFLKTNGKRKHLLVIQNHQLFSGIWRVKKIHPGGKVITCFMHRDVEIPPLFQVPRDQQGQGVDLEQDLPDFGQGLGGQGGGPMSPEPIPMTTTGRLPPLSSPNPRGGGEGGTTNATGSPFIKGGLGAIGAGTAEHVNDVEYWDIELHPDKEEKVPQNLTLVKKIPVGDNKHLRRKKVYVCFAPPLLFHTRVDIQNIWKIDTMNQMFSADVLVEARLRSVVAGEFEPEAAQDAIDELFLLYEVDVIKMLEVRNADFTDFVSWHERVETNVLGKYDYAFKLRCKAFFNQVMDLAPFPFDQHSLSVRLRLNMPARLGALLLDDARPSHFYEDCFQLHSLWRVVNGTLAICDMDPPPLDEIKEAPTPAHERSPEMLCIVKINRRYEYYLYNVFIPMVMLALGGAVSNCIGDTSSIFTGERVFLLLGLLVGVFVLRYTVSHAVSHAANLTQLDRCVNLCALCLVLSILLNIIISRPVFEGMVADEVCAIIYIVSATLVLGWWCYNTYTYLSEREEDDAYIRDDERKRRQANEEKKILIDHLRVSKKIKTGMMGLPIKAPLGHRRPGF